MTVRTGYDRAMTPLRKMGSPQNRRFCGERRRQEAQTQKTRPRKAIGFSEPCARCADVVPVAGVEPARHRWRRILSPLRLPIPSYRHIMIFDENLQKRSLEIGGPFRRPIGNFKKMKSEKVQENQGFASSRAGVDESDFESATSTNSIIPADMFAVPRWHGRIGAERDRLPQHGGCAPIGGIIVHSGQNSKQNIFAARKKRRYGLDSGSVTHYNNHQKPARRAESLRGWEEIPT